MAIYLTLDCGTTNTRVHLVKGETLCDTVRCSIGADGKDQLKAALREAIKTLLQRHSLTEEDVSAIVASGMITSELGLCPLTHLPLPADREALHHGMETRLFPEISSIPITFIRGVRAEGDDLSLSDVMRGEETELMGILHEGGEDTLYVLPGSHSKLISTNRSGRITRFSTMLSGELFAAVSRHTILQKSFSSASVTEFDRDALYNGFSYCREHGINEALFKVRILKNHFSASEAVCYGFLLGVILCGEAEAILKAPERTVVIGGQKQLREALAELLRRIGKKKLHVLSDGKVAASTVIGAVRIFENR